LVEKRVLRFAQDDKFCVSAGGGVAEKRVLRFAQDDKFCVSAG